MKKPLLVVLLFLLSATVIIAQKSVQRPIGFQRAIPPESIKDKHIDQNIPLRKGSPYVINSSPLSVSVIEKIIGNTAYDLQTSGSISNRLCVNDDSTISAVWTYSPDHIQTTTPPYPHRGTGYNFFNNSAWYYPAGPASREESYRTGSTNVVVTPSAELLIAHSSDTGGTTRIIISRRSGRGSGSWSSTFPFESSHDICPKACAAASSGSNENVYLIFRGENNSLNIDGPIYFSRSLNGGITWTPKFINPLIDSTVYPGFREDNYSIDARDSIVVIGFGSVHTDVGILKSTDYGVTWTKTIIQQLPSPLPDTVYSSGGDINVLIDNNGMAHAWFSSFMYSNDSILGLNALFYSDGIEYWNESMGGNNYVDIAATQDYNGNGIIDFPVDTSIICTTIIPAGNFKSGLSIQPSAGIDANGVIYLSYSAIDENTDTVGYPFLRRHVYMKTLAPPYNVADWTYPYDIIPSIANGGNGENQEGVFASISKRVIGNHASVLYQRDHLAGHSLSSVGTCDNILNLGNFSDIIYATIDLTTLNIVSTDVGGFFVSENFPNPSSGLTNINVELKMSSDIKLEVFDVVGRIVHSEDRKNIRPGGYTFSINTSDLKSGIYLLCVSANGQRISRKMIVD